MSPAFGDEPSQQRFDIPGTIAEGAGFISEITDTGVDFSADILGTGIGGAANIGLNIFNILSEKARVAISVSKKASKALGRFARNTSGASSRRAKKLANKLLKLKDKLVKQRKLFKKFSRKVLNIAQAGREVPKPLARKVGNLGVKIIQLEAKVLQATLQADQLLNASSGN